MLPISLSDRHPVKPPATRDVSQLNKGNGSFELVLSPLILAMIGFWLDRSVLHTTPWMTVTFALLGLVGATIKLYYTYRFKMAELDAAAPWRAGERAA